MPALTHKSSIVNLMQAFLQLLFYFYSAGSYYN